MRKLLQKANDIMYAHIIFRVALFLAIAAVLFVLVNRILIGKTYYYDLPAHMADTPYLLAAKQDGFYALEKDTVDVVFLGNSRIHTSVNPVVLWNEYGIAAYDFSADQQSLGMTYWYLQEMFRYQHPKVVVINPVISPGPASGPLAHFSLDFLRSLDLKILGIMDTTVASEWLENLFPIIKYHSRWDELRVNDFEYLYSDKRHTLMGFLGYIDPNKLDAATFVTSDQTTDLDSTTKEQLDRIVELCRENDTQVLFAKAPWSSSEEEQAQYNGMDQYLSSLSVPSLNGNRYIDEINIDFEFDYVDIVHMTYSGAEKFSLWIGAYLSEHYGLVSHKGDTRYDAWEEGYRLYAEKKLTAETPPAINYTVEETVLEVPLLTLENTSGEVGVQMFDMSGLLEPNTEYRVALSIKSPANMGASAWPDLFYVDFYGSNYDNVEQDMSTKHERWRQEGEFEGRCNTGNDIPDDVWMRVVFVTDAEYTIENLILQKIIYQ